MKPSPIILMDKTPVRKALPLLIVALGFFSLGIGSIILLGNAGGGNGTIASEASRSCVEPAEVQYAAPNLNLLDLNLHEVRLDDYLGEVVLLNTWATWCPPCLAEMPDLQTFFEKYRLRGFTLIGVNIGETQDQVIEFASQNQLTFPLWLDPHEQSMQALKTMSLPYSVVIDRDGVIRLAWSGATCLDALETRVAPLIFE